MKLIVGLGNPGPRYRNTRHNAGFMALDCLAGRLDSSFSRETHQALMAEGEWEGETLLLVKPLTLVNNSGAAVAEAVRSSIGDRLKDLLVVLDDVYLPLGTLRIRPGGSAGGHNGLMSIIERLGTDELPRLRMGVGENGNGIGLTDHVLGTFAPDEMPDVEAMVERAAEAVMRFVTCGIERAMNEFN